MEIHSAHGLSMPQPTWRRLQGRREEVAGAGRAYADEIELSLGGDGPDAAIQRSLRIARIQEEIAAGEYDSVERLAAAVYRLVEELGL